VLRLGKVQGLRWLGGATAFPAQELDNVAVLRRAHPDWPDARVAFSAAGILANLGLDRRAWVTDETSVTLGVRAAMDARKVAGDPTIDALLVATSTPTRMTSSVASAIAAELGLSALALDVRGGCSAGLFALSQAADWATAGATVMVVGTDTFSRVLPRDPMLHLAMGDGAAAVILGPGGAEARLSGAFLTEPAPDLVGMAGPLPPSAEAVAADAYRLSGDMLGFGDAAAAVYGRVGEAALGEVRPEWLLPQQTQRPMIEALARQFSIRNSWSQVGRHANIGAGNLLSAWIEARREGFCPSGSVGLCVAVGGGVTGAAVVWQC
jgi:3-oxoacyl-[acyl-carrier-protein] synthase-3